MNAVAVEKPYTRTALPPTENSMYLILLTRGWLERNLLP